jgi:tryptophanyl-tRNA synthetase
LLCAFADADTVREVETRYRAGGIGYGEVKALLAEVIETHVAPMRDRYRRLLTDPDALEARLTDGARHAHRRAEGVLGRTMAAMGLGGARRPGE